MNDIVSSIILFGTKYRHLFSSKARQSFFPIKLILSHVSQTKDKLVTSVKIFQHVLHFSLQVSKILNEQIKLKEDLKYKYCNFLESLVTLKNLMIYYLLE